LIIVIDNYAKTPAQDKTATGVKLMNGGGIVAAYVM
jgi:hypothetical protein